MCHPWGSPFGVVRIRRSQPPSPLATVLRNAMGYFADSPDTTTQRLVTSQGEFAVIASLGPPPVCSRSAHRHVALIAGSSAMIRLEGFCENSEHRGSFSTEFRDMVSHCTTGEASLRRRMYTYEPPRLWHGMRRSASTVWYPPAVPVDTDSVEVFDAVPLDDAAAQRTHELMAGPVSGPPTSITTRNGLSGSQWVSREFAAVRLTDHRFSYEVRYAHTTNSTPHVAAFESLVGSIESLPHRGGLATTSSALQESQWRF